MTETSTSTDTELAREQAVVGSRDVVVSLDSTSVVVRLQGKGPDALYVAMTPERAMRIGAAFLRGALRLKPQISLQLVEDEIRKTAKPLRAVNGSDVL